MVERQKQRLVLALLFMAACGPAAAQEASGPVAAGSQSSPVICLTIDAAHDTLTSSERVAAITLLGRQFTSSGWRVVENGCTETYSVSHVTLGRLITVRIAGPRGEREGRAVGLEDLPALYSQMARSFATGKPLGSLDLLDRTNVTEEQTTTKRMAVDTFHYARLGFGMIAADRAYGAPLVGFGYRAEFDTFGLDVAYFTYQITGRSGGYAASSSGAVSGSMVRIAGLRFFNGKGQASRYAGGGLSWGVTSVHHSSSAPSSSYTSSSWTGSGLRAELIGGYEFTRATKARMFVQADLVLPLYRLTASSYSYPKTGSSSLGTRYSPSLTVSIGIGWHREHR